jgi:hypothetical protein
VTRLPHHVTCVRHGRKVGGASQLHKKPPSLVLVRLGIFSVLSRFNGGF